MYLIQYLNNQYDLLYEKYTYCKKNYCTTSGIINLVKMGLQEINTRITLIVLTLFIGHKQIDEKQNCAICLNEFTDALNSEQCKHSYCMNCIYTYWVHNGRRQLKCPICRTKIKTFLTSFRIEKQQLKLCHSFIVPYNIRHGNYKILYPFRTIRNAYTQLKQLMKQIWDLTKLLVNLSLMLVLTILILYIASPIDFIPELYFGFIGLIDDVLCVFFFGWIVITLMFLR